MSSEIGEGVIRGFMERGVGGVGTLSYYTRLAFNARRKQVLRGLLPGKTGSGSAIDCYVDGGRSLNDQEACSRHSVRVCAFIPSSFYYLSCVVVHLLLRRPRHPLGSSALHLLVVVVPRRYRRRRYRLTRLLYGETSISNGGNMQKHSRATAKLY